MWIVLIPALVIGGLLDAAGGEFLKLPGYEVALQHLDVPHFLTSLFFLQELVLPPFGSNGPLWSLSYEFWYYVWFPPIAIMAIRRRPAWPWVGFLAVTMAVGFVYAQAFPAWLLGAGVHLVSRRWRPGGAARWRYLPLAAGGTAFVLGEGVSHALNLSLVQGVFVVGFGFACLLLGILLSNAGVPGWASPLADYGARSSFSLYLVHCPLVFLLTGIAGVHSTRPRAAFAIALAITAAALVYGYVFSVLTERRTDDIRRWLARFSSRVRAAEGWSGDPGRYDGTPG